MKTYVYDIHSIKASIKLKKWVDLNKVKQRVLERQSEGLTLNKEFPSFIVIGNLPVKSDTYNQRCKLTLFKYGHPKGRIVKAVQRLQHCNVCGITCFKDIPLILKEVERLFDLSEDDMVLTVDNINAGGRLPPLIKAEFIQANSEDTFHQLETFPGMKLRFQKVTIMTFASGAMNFSGAKSEAQIQEAFQYMQGCFVKYQALSLENGNHIASSKTTIPMT